MTTLLGKPHIMSDRPRGERALVNLTLSVAGEPLQAEVKVPTAPIRPVDMLPIFMSFDDAVIGVAAEQVRREGKTITCRAGCGACCRQLVPIGDTEARYLSELVAEMPDQRRARVESRFREALAELDRKGMLRRLRNASQLEDFQARRQLGVDYFNLKVPCPFLEEESCSIHLHRPLTCREYLVTSPAENCTHPLPQKISKVPVPASLSKVLSRFGDGVGNRPARWLPLVMALEWVANQGDGDQPRVPGVEMFENFLRLVAGAEGQVSFQQRTG